MILNCNSCGKKFVVPDNAISATGRTVQCGSCGNKWKQFPTKEIKQTQSIPIPQKQVSKARQVQQKIQKPKKLNNLFKYFFGEDQARYIVEIEASNLSKAEKILKNNNIYYENIGFTQNKYFEIEGELKISTKDLFEKNNEWYKSY